MAKLPNVTNEELAAVIERAQDLSGDLHDIANRMEKGYSDEIAMPLEKVRALVNIIRNAADCQTAIMMKSALDEQRHEVETLMAKRAAG